MTKWKTVVVCDECYRARRDADDQLIDNPVRLSGMTEPCADCGGEGDIPIRVAVPDA